MYRSRRLDPGGKIWLFSGVQSALCEGENNGHFFNLMFWAFLLFAWENTPIYIELKQQQQHTTTQPGGGSLFFHTHFENHDEASRYLWHWSSVCVKMSDESFEKHSKRKMRDDYTKVQPAHRL